MSQNPAPLYVLAPNVSRSEADEIRQLFGAPERKVHVCYAPGHTPGQTISGDVVVLGEFAASTIDQDATGSVKRYKDIGAARRALAPKEQVEQKSEPRPQAHPEPQRLPEPQPEPKPQPRTEPESEPDPEPDPASDRFDEMDRGELIRHGATKWPGRRRWAIMTEETLRQTIRELEAGD